MNENESNILDARVTKSELVELIIQEQLANLEKEKLKLQEKEEDLKPKYDFLFKKDKELKELIKEDVFRQNKSIVSLFSKNGRELTLANHRYPSSNILYVPLKSVDGKIAGTFSLYSLPLSFYINASERTSTGGTRIVFTAYIEYTPSAKVKKFYDELLSIATKAIDVRKEINLVDLEIDKTLKSKSKLKASLTQQVLESSPEGKIILKELAKIKGKIKENKLLA